MFSNSFINAPPDNCNFGFSKNNLDGVSILKSYNNNCIKFCKQVFTLGFSITKFDYKLASTEWFSNILQC